MAGDALFPARGAEPFVGGGLDPHLFHRHPQLAGDRGPHRLDMGAQLGTLGHHHRVDVDHLPTPFPHQLHYVRQQGQAVGPLPSLLLGGEMAADVAEPEGAEQGVHQGMHQHIGVAVAVEAQSIGVAQADAPQDQRSAADQPVDVVPIADPQLHGACAYVKTPQYRPLMGRPWGVWSQELRRKAPRGRQHSGAQAAGGRAAAQFIDVLGKDVTLCVDISDKITGSFRLRQLAT